MKTNNVLMITIGLIGLFVLAAAFMNVDSKKTVKRLQTTDQSKGFAVVELFTSEGCSSCPPADELLAEIERENRNTELYILAFHVDYWDHQGWKDSFSDAEFSLRQRQYATWMNLRTVYTPQIVVNGTDEYVGSDQGMILKAISAGLDQEQTKSLILHGEVAGDQLKVDYQGAGEDKKSELVLTLVQKSAKSNVRAGENAGRSLSHVQIVRQLLRTDLNNKERIAMHLPKDFKKNGWELIGFIQNKTNGRITNAARVEL